ncbi:MAG: polysaccharide export protein [Bryobacterales bacterium]|nr:polysaccharide export protein [Bryobacterales bacterium]
MPARLLVLLIAAVTATVISAQERPAQPTEPLPSANLQVQKIGANDLISISVYDCPELTRTYRIAANGQIHLPMLKARIDAAGLLPGELEEKIAAALDREQIMIRPVVTVTVAEYASRPISVAGAVKNPLKFQAVGNVTILDAIARAGGLSPDAGAEILLTGAKTAEGTAPLVRRIQVKGLIDEADASLNVALAGGEEVRVPEAGKIFVVGNVKKPGAYSAGGKSDCTILKALAYAEGLAPFAFGTAYIYRQDDGGKHNIPVELGRIMARKSPDITLLPNDILYIPDNVTRRHTVGALEKALGFGTSTASGLLIWK